MTFFFGVLTGFVLCLVVIAIVSSMETPASYTSPEPMMLVAPPSVAPPGE